MSRTNSSMIRNALNSNDSNHRPIPRTQQACSMLEKMDKTWRSNTGATRIWKENQQQQQEQPEHNNNFTTIIITSTTQHHPPQPLTPKHPVQHADEHRVAARVPTRNANRPSNNWPDQQQDHKRGTSDNNNHDSQVQPKEVSKKRPWSLALESLSDSRF